VDCAIAANADFIITNDSDYAPLANAGYKPQPISPEEFMPSIFLLDCPDVA
jgi:predicted nucleic acid-binding protein